MLFRSNAVVIGGGDVAARKIELLLKTNAKITIISATVNISVERLINTHQLKWLSQNFAKGMLKEFNLVIAATDNSAVNSEVHQEAEQLDILINVVDQPELCSYITPAIIDRSPILVALSSSGSAPILIRMLREKIEKILPDNYGRLADFSLKFREHVKAKVKDLRNRRTFWEKTLRGSIGQEILYGNTTHAEQQLIASLNQKVLPTTGEIVFIHTKNGDPDQLTLQAHRELQYADAVFYDDEVNIALIEYVRRDADKYPQSIASNILINYRHAIELAEQGGKVIYLLAGYQVLPKNALLSQSKIKQTSIISGGS